MTSNFTADGCAIYQTQSRQVRLSPREREFLSSCVACADHNAVYKLSIDNNYTLDALVVDAMRCFFRALHSQSSILIFYDHRINLFHNLQVFPPLTHSKPIQKTKKQTTTTTTAWDFWDLQQQHKHFFKLFKIIYIIIYIHSPNMPHCCCHSFFFCARSPRHNAHLS